MSQTNPCPYCVEDVVDGNMNPSFKCGLCGYTLQQLGPPKADNQPLQILLIKAPSPDDAAEYVKQRGFKVSHVLSTGSPTQFAVRVTPDNTRAINWYANSGNLAEADEWDEKNGYPFGTLLWYSN